MAVELYSSSAAALAALPGILCCVLCRVLMCCAVFCPTGQDPPGVTRKERLLEIFGHW